MTDDDFVRLVQGRLSHAGHYTGGVDGIAGKGTVAALDKALPPLTVISPAPSADLPAAGQKPGVIPISGLSKLKGVNDALVRVVELAALKSPHPFTVTEGLRSAVRQAQLVKAGASKTQNSRHLTGHAVDLWPLDPKTLKPLPSDAAFPAGSNEARAASAALWAGLRAIAVHMKDAAKELGVQIEWGGDWGWDGPHFQLNRKAYPA